MSAGEKAYAMLKSMMLMGERFGGLGAKIGMGGADLAALGRSHAELAQRVARLEGFVEGAVTAARPPQIEG